MAAVTSKTNIDNIKSFQDILRQLNKLESSLSTDKLGHYEVFNRAYLVVTKSIKQATEENYFGSPDFIERFSSCFASHYFQAVNNTINKNPDLPPAWAIMNRAGRHKATPRSVLLLMGANAHINNDLPLVLLKQSQAVENQGLISDVIKVDKLLMKCGRDIINTFDEASPTLNRLKRRLIFLYYRPVMYMVLYWRIHAWRSYKRLQKDGAKNSGYTKRSIVISKRFLKLASYFNQ